MYFDILKIEDKEDGGAIVSIEVDRDFLHFALERYFNQVIMDAVDETFGEAEARKVVIEDGGSHHATQEEKNETDLGQRTKVDNGSYRYPDGR